MFPLRSLAATSPRQLEQLVACTPAFLLPSFASTSAPLPTATAPRQRQSSSLASSSKHAKGKRPSTEVLAVLREQMGDDALGEVSSSRLRTSRRAGTGIRMAHSSAAPLRREPPELLDEEVEEGDFGASTRREGKGVAVEQSNDIDEAELSRRAVLASEELFRKMAKAPREPPPLPPSSHPPSSSLTSHLFHHDPPTIESYSSLSVNPSPSSLPSTISQPIIPHPPATRAELMQLLARTPSDVSLPYLLALQDIIRKDGYLDDSAPVTQLASSAIKASLPQISFAERLLKQALSHMCAPSLPRNNLARVLEQPVKHLVQRRLWEEVVAFTNIAVSKRINSLRLIEWRMQALYELRRYPETVEAFSLFEQHRLQPTGDAFDDLVGAQLLNANLGAAQAALADKAERGFPTTVKTCLALLDGMWMFGGNRVMEQRVLEEQNEQALKRMKATCQDVKVLNRIMSVRASRGDNEDAFAVLDHFNLDKTPRLGFALRRFTSAVSSSSSSSPSPSSPPHPFFRPPPDLATIVILTGIFLRLRRTDLASSLFVESQLAGLGLNEYLVAAVVRTHLAQEDLAGAETFVFAIGQGEATIAKPISRAERKAGFSAPIDASQITLAPFEPTPKIYEVLLGGVLRYRGLQGAAELLERMARGQKQSVEVTEGMVAALVEYVAIERGEEPRTNAELIVRMYELTARKRKPTIDNLNQLLEAAWKKERWSGPSGIGKKPWAARREQRKREMRERLLPSAFLEPALGMSEDPVAVPTHLPSATATDSPTTSSSLPTPITRIHSSLLDRRTQPGTSTTGHHLRASSSVNSMWDYLQTSLIDRGIRPTHSHLAIILRAYIRLGDPSGAHETLQRSFDHFGVQPHVSLYSVLVGGLAKLGMWDQAMTVYREMRERGLEPDRTMFAALAMAASRRRDVDGVRAVWDEAASRFAPTSSANAEYELQGAGGADVGLDAVFVSIMYRTLAQSGRLLEAQELMSSKLAEGMKPDEAVYFALQRTRRWLKWQGNKIVEAVPSSGPRSTSPPPQRSSTTPKISSRNEEHARAVKLNFANIRQVRSALRREIPEGRGGLKELQRLEPFLAGKGNRGGVARSVGRKKRVRRVSRPNVETKSE